MRIWLWILTVPAAMVLPPLGGANVPALFSCWCCMRRLLLLLLRKTFLHFFFPIQPLPRLSSPPVNMELPSTLFPIVSLPILTEAGCYLLTPSRTLVHKQSSRLIIPLYRKYRLSHFLQIFQSYMSLFNSRDGDHPRFYVPSLPQDMSSHALWDHPCNLLCGVPLVIVRLRNLRQFLIPFSSTFRDKDVASITGHLGKRQQLCLPDYSSCPPQLLGTSHAGRCHLSRTRKLIGYTVHASSGHRYPQWINAHKSSSAGRGRRAVSSWDRGNDK